MKIYKSLIVIIVLILFVGMLFWFFNNKSMEKGKKMIDCAVLLSSIVVDLVRDEGAIDALKLEYSAYLSDSIESQILNYKKDLQSRKNFYLDLDDVFNKEGVGVFDIEDTVEDPVVNEIEYTQEEIELYFPDEVVSSNFIEEYDNRIEIIDGARKINVETLNFDSSDKAYVLYKSFYMEFDRKNVPETYNMMLRNPVHNYRYVTNKKGKDVIDVLFKSLYDSNEIIVRLGYNGYKIISFEVIK